MATRWQISQDVRSADAIPYFNWDAPITNAEVRRALQSGSTEDRVYWIARIMREAQYYDVWAFVSLRRDVLPLWEQLRPRLGRRRAFWMISAAIASSKERRNASPCSVAGIL